MYQEQGKIPVLLKLFEKQNMLEKKDLTRRTFIAATGGMLALPLLTSCDSGGGGQTDAAVGSVSRPVTLHPQTTDLTIRFEHVEPKISLPGLLAAWSFDEGCGYIFRDLSGHGYDAYIAGTNWMTTDSGLTAALHQKGRRGNAVYLNGSQWLQIQHRPALEVRGQCTLAAWIKADKAPSAMPWQSIIQKLEKDQGYALLLGEQNTLRFSVRDTGGHDHFVDSAANTVPQGQWMHVLASCDAATGQLSMYLNGKQVANVHGSPFTPGKSSTDLMLGHSSWLKDAFQGWIDEVVFFERVLTPTEINQLYVVGLPRVYRQTRETIDSDRRIWNTFKGNQPIPHPLESDTVFSVRFNGSLISDQGQEPVGAVDARSVLVPGYFGGAFAALHHPALTYSSPLTTAQGTCEAWFIPELDSSDPRREQKKVLFRAEGNEYWLELYTQDRRWQATLGKKSSPLVTIQSASQEFAYGELLHLGLTWGMEKDSRQQALVLYLNGVEAARANSPAKDATLFDRHILLGGTGAATAYGSIDEVRISDTVHSWGTFYPRGHVYSEAAALDMMDTCSHTAGEPPVLWRPGSSGAGWSYALKDSEKGGAETKEPSLLQATAQGFHPLFHPAAYGQMSSLEAGIAFDAMADGWAGIFIQAPTEPGAPLSGYSFAMNPQRNQLRLAIHRAGTIVVAKVLPYDFPFTSRRTYTLTLSSINDGVLRGYIDGNSMLSLRTKDQPAFTQGYAGLFTENTTAYFATVHFSALTPATEKSRQVQQRIFTMGQSGTISYENLSLNAFRWQKRYGLPPWQRTTKDPQVPGCIFSAADGVPVPNKSAPWRAEDSANTDMLHVDGKVLLLMRGNPRYNDISGVAALGGQYTAAADFDGIHFTDPNVGISDLDHAELLRGHLDTAPPEMRDQPPRDQRLQVNDLGGTYIGNGKVLVFAREFRNTVQPYPWYRRLVYGLYDVQSGTWGQREGHYVSWSSMDPNASAATFAGIDGTPDVKALRDPDNDHYIFFLFHAHKQDATPTTGITGLQFAKEGQEIVLHPDYPTRGSYTKPNGDVIYGERVLFDNGIYYVHYNSASDQIQGDWPDRFALAASLHPYSQPWVNSADNSNPKRAYFQRGGELDYDNGAIWSGELFKYRGRYYLYYEGFHAIDDVNAPYQNYDALDAGSRLCYATAN